MFQHDKAVLLDCILSLQKHRFYVVIPLSSLPVCFVTRFPLSYLFEQQNCFVVVRETSMVKEEKEFCLCYIFYLYKLMSKWN
jgi:hypothetical protein